MKMKKNRKQRFLNLVLSAIMAASPAGASVMTVQAMSDEAVMPHAEEQTFTLKAGTEAVLTDLFGLDPETEWYFDVLGTGICEIDTRSVDTGDGFTRSVDYLRALTPGKVYVRAEGESEQYTFAVVVTPGDTPLDPDTTVEITLKSFETLDLAGYMEETYSQQATMEYDSIVASYDPFDGILHALLPGEAYLEERDENGELYFTIHVTVEENPLTEQKTIADLQPVALSSLAEVNDDLSYVQTYGFPDPVFSLSDTDEGTMVNPLMVSTGYLVGYDELDTVLFVLEVSVANPSNVQPKRLPMIPGSVLLFDQIRADLNIQNLTFQTPAENVLTLNAEKDRAESNVSDPGESLLAAYNEQGTLCGLYTLYPALTNGEKTLEEQKTYTASELLGFETSIPLIVNTDNTDVAIGAEDTLQTRAAGTAKVIVTTDDGKEVASWQVTVKENLDIPAETVVVSLTQEEVLNLNDYFSAEELSSAVVSYDEQNITFNRTSGKLTFHTAGEYQVNVTLASGKVHPFLIQVAKKVYNYLPIRVGDIHELPEELNVEGLTSVISPEGALREIAHKTYVITAADEDGHASVVFKDSEGNIVHEQYFAVAEEELPAAEILSMNPGQTKDLMSFLGEASLENTRFYVQGTAAQVEEQGVLSAKADGDASVFAAVNGHLEKEWHVVVHTAETKVLEGRTGQQKELAFSEEGLKNPSLTSSDSEVVRVDDLHHITLLKAGTASVRLSEADGADQTIWLITVKDADAFTLSGLEGQQMKLAFSDEEAADAVLSAEDEEIVRVDDLHHITLLKAGETVVSLKDSAGVPLAVWTVTVNAPVQMDLSGLETEELELNYSEDGIDGARLESGDEDIVSIIDLHHIALGKAGETTVVLKDSDGIVHRIWNVTVNEPEKLSLSGVEGQQMELTFSEEGIDSPRLESSNENIVSADDLHHITLRQAGEVQLSLKDSNGVIHIVWTINVHAPAQTVLSGLEGEQKELTYSEEGIEGAVLLSDNEEIVRVDDLHHITLLKAGTAALTLKDAAGVIHALWTVNVSAPETFELSGLKGTQLELTFSEEGLSSPALTSSDESILRVDDLHHVTLVGAGQASVTLKEENGAVHAIWMITVTEPDTPVLVFDKRVNTGTTLDLMTDLSEDQKEGISFASSAEDIVSVDENGQAHILKAGAAVITACADDKTIAVWNIEAIEAARLSQTLKTGETAAPAAAEGVDLSTLTLTSSDPETVAVTENKEFSALKAGTVTIEGVDDEGILRAIWTVTVKDRPVLVEESYTGYENSTLDLSTYLSQYEGLALAYASSDEETVSVDENAVITLHKPGEALISVSLDGDPVLNLHVTIRARGIPGWSDDRQKFVKEDGTYACNEWIEYAGGRYAFDENELVRKGWYTDENGDAYHLNENTGVMTASRWVGERWLGADGKEITDPDLMGWITDSYGQKRYMTKDNIQFRNGFLDINGKTYLFGVFGELKTGWNKVEGYNYYSDANGVIQKNCWIDDTYWVEEDGRLAVSKWVDNNRYYVDANGRKVLNPKPQQWVKDSYGKKWQLEDGSFLRSSWLTIDGKTYYLKSDTYAATGWLGLGGYRYLFNSDGVRQTGLVSDGGRLYYLDPENEGRMATGWKTVNGYDYYFTSSGASATGWVNRGTARYYYTSEGKPYQGWLEDGDKSYFIHRGKMMTGWLSLGGMKYYLGDDGVCRKYWQQMDGNWYYFYGSGAMATGWVTQKIGTFYLDPETGIMATGMVEIDGTLCNFDEGGHATGGWVTREDGVRYYFDSNGKAHHGWLTEGGKSYFINHGRMLTGWVTLGGMKYHLADDGVCSKYWVQMDGNWYYFYGSGAMATGWVTQKIGTFYLDPETGIMATGMVEIDGTLCNFDEGGHATGGWVTREDGVRYYFDSNGKAHHGWLTEGGKSYFINHGRMLTGWVTLGGMKYCLGADGVCLKYWQKMDGNWYYFYGSGAMATGWVTQKIGTFYLDPETGIMATGMTVIDGVRWFFNEDGKYGTGWAEDETGKYYFEDGKPVTGWKDLDGFRYYFLEDGKMATGQVTIDGTDYWFDQDGHLLAEGEEQPDSQNE